MKPQILSLDSEALVEFRISLDESIRLLVKNMELRNMEEGSVNAKLKIEMRKTVGENMAAETALRLEPSVSIKIGNSAKMNCSVKSGLFMKIDDEGKPIIGDNQISIDEMLQNE